MGERTSTPQKPMHAPSDSNDESHAVLYLQEGKRVGRYGGRSSYEHKTQLRDLGAKWHAESKQWVAHSTDILLAIARAGANASDGASSAKKDACFLLWKPTAFTSVNNAIYTLLVRRAAEENKSRFAPSSKDNVVDAELERERVNAHLRRELCIPKDSEAELRMVDSSVEKWMVAASAGIGKLGPRSGLSDAARLLRGVRLGIITWSELTAWDFSQPHSDRKVRRRHSDSAAQARDEHPPPATAAEVQRCEKNVSCAKRGPLAFRHRRFACPDCRQDVDTRRQFLDCLCGSWNVCCKCGGADTSSDVMSGLRACRLDRAHQCTCTR